MGISWCLKTKNGSESSGAGRDALPLESQRSSWRKWNGGTEDWEDLVVPKTETWVGMEIELLVEKKGKQSSEVRLSQDPV